MNQGKLEVVKQEMARVNINILGISELNGLQQANLICHQYANKFGKLSSSYRTGKGQFSFQSQRKAMPKNVQTTAQLHSSHMLEK